MAGCQNERRKNDSQFLNKEKDKKIYDVWVDRYVTVGYKILVTTENIPI